MQTSPGPNPEHPNRPDETWLEKAISADPGFKALHASRLRQQREMARGCLLALVMEGAALLAAGLWLVALLLEMPRLANGGLFGLIAFTLAAAGVGMVVLVQGNLPKQRRLVREHDQMLQDLAPGDELAKNEPDR